MQAIMTPEEMAAVDAAASEPVEELVERAGAAIARAAVELLGGTYGRRVVVLAGKGNNGADGRAAADRLRRRGVRCTVVDAADAPPTLPAADLVIDAAYGTGFRGSFQPPAVADPTTPVLAVDIPSGVSGLTGDASGSPWPAVRTVTFAALKPGLLLGEGPGLAGQVVLADIGLDVSGARAWRVEAEDVAAWLPARPTDSHKWKAAAWLVAGSPGMVGAAHLATRAAQRAGAGYVRLSTPGSDQDPFAPTEAVVVALAAEGWASTVLDGEDRFGALAVGPGLGTGAGDAEQVRLLVAGSRSPVVVDGDGLRALGPGAAEAISERAPDAGPVVLTPHDGEFEALDGGPPEAGRFAAARRLAGATGAVVLLKGPTTLMARPDGHVWATTTGDARLASAGTGDVLTGTVVALLAQGMPADRAASAAAYLHGRAGALAWRRGLVAGDVVDQLPAALSELPGG
ncbi:NAD(P)H-hydrate dehydratase [Aquihabitans sp. G128]|uniref:NAD(P)H-hydrate dehydratase n=1 Tax=Aquihabitans sp. G128 TaxID=2849779 RepID=UPI001C212738|nr:NAD(P)H-hydrate dehydratase [Aquihabitans sp. G128]QXC60348.1 NAD(P)H-hydrate dehydratase [Aquihabitans sp. G128]